ncbi:Rpn family recombination-promoting nuclease/putative transposase [Anaerolineales bacterium HSG24]|nr:Rpn family recombination-promoting nuclease/putative transposase [Anaerolineales bacterium HSG24]
MKFVNPKNDVAFRKIFGSQNKTNILISFLNAVLGLKDEKAIQSVRILNPYQTPKLEKLKTTILDVRATDERGVTFIVEMQISYTSGVRKRFAYYLAKAYSSQIKRGEDYPKLNQVFFIGVLDFVLFGRKKGAARPYLSRHQVLDTETHRQEFKDLELNFIELPNFDKKEHEVATLLEKWVYFIKHADDLDVIPEHADDPSLQDAYKTADQLGWSQDDLEAYEYRGMRIQDERGAITHAREEGRKEGHEKGEKHKAIKMACKMKAKGYDAVEIADLTDLTVEEIEAIELSEYANIRMNVAFV